MQGFRQGSGGGGGVGGGVCALATWTDEAAEFMAFRRCNALGAGTVAVVLRAGRKGAWRFGGWAYGQDLSKQCW